MKHAVIALAVAATLGACNRTPSDSVPADALPHPLLWSAEKDGRTTYFFGTMHSGVDAARQLPPIVWSKLDAGRAFAMETDLDDPAAAAALAARTASLRDSLGPEYWAKLERALGRETAHAVEHMPPMIPAAALAMRGLPTTPAMDKVMSARAAGEHKPIVFLEPASRQIGLLVKWMDVKALKLLLDELPWNEQHAKAMLDAYVTGDDRKILALSDDERRDALGHGYTAAEYDREMDDLLYGRNASWVSALEQLHADGGGFVAVGALHLIGPRSVLDLLAQRGFRVTRVGP